MSLVFTENDKTYRPVKLGRMQTLCLLGRNIQERLISDFCSEHRARIRHWTVSCSFWCSVGVLYRHSRALYEGRRTCSLWFHSFDVDPSQTIRVRKHDKCSIGWYRVATGGSTSLLRNEVLILILNARHLFLSLHVSEGSPSAPWMVQVRWIRCCASKALCHKKAVRFDEKWKPT